MRFFFLVWFVIYMQSRVTFRTLGIEDNCTTKMSVSFMIIIIWKSLSAQMERVL